MWNRIIRDFDLLLTAILFLFGFGLIFWLYQKPDVDAVATFVGALFGGSALLLGNWINRHNDRHRATEEIEQRSAKLKALIAAELVHVAIGLLGAKQILDAALITKKSGGQVPEQLDMSSYMPRDMPVTDSLGAELLILEQAAIDSLVTLRSNLSVTSMSMEEVTRGATFGFMRITELSNEVRHDMGVLADTFEQIAPTRRLELPNQKAELATVIFRRMSLADDCVQDKATT